MNRSYPRSSPSKALDTLHSASFVFSAVPLPPIALLPGHPSGQTSEINVVSTWNMRWIPLCSSLKISESKHRTDHCRTLYTCSNLARLLMRGVVKLSIVIFTRKILLGTSQSRAKRVSRGCIASTKSLLLTAAGQLPPVGGGNRVRWFLTTGLVNLFYDTQHLVLSADHYMNMFTVSIQGYRARRLFGRPCLDVRS